MNCPHRIVRILADFGIGDQVTYFDDAEAVPGTVLEIRVDPLGLKYGVKWSDAGRDNENLPTYAARELARALTVVADEADDYASDDEGWDDAA